MATTQTLPSGEPAGGEGKRPQRRTEMWDPAIETLSRDEIHALQSQRLERQVHHIYHNARFFRELWDAAGVHPRDIRSVDDLWKLPTFDKDALRADRDRTGDPFAGTLCVPASQLTFVTHSTGTSGKPNLFGITKDELEELGHLFSRALYTIGVRPGYQGVFVGGIRWHGFVIAWDKALEQMGVTKYYLGNGPQDIVIQTFEMAPDIPDFDVTFVYQPEAELEYIRRTGVDPKQLYPNLKLLWSAVDATPLRRRMWEEIWGAPFRNLYGSGDQFWIAPECPHDYRYTHAPEDYFIFEVLDPLTGEPVPPGGTGVLYVTNLWMRSNPYVRYCMEDMVTYEVEPCSCGRTSMRLSVRGRFAWSIRIGEDYVFSQEVENVLWAQPDMMGANYQLVRKSEQPQDKLIVRVHPNELPHTDELKAQLEAALTRELHVPSEVIFVGAGEIGTKGVKMQRVIEM